MEREVSEQVFFEGHPSWRAMLAFYVKGLGVAILAGALGGVITRVAAGHVQGGWVGVIVLVVFLIVLGAGLVRRMGTTYAITSERLTIRTGLLSRDLQETRLERVQNVRCRQSLLERLLRVGTVEFDTAGGAAYDFSFHGVASPRQIVRTVDGALRELGPGERMSSPL